MPSGGLGHIPGGCDGGMIGPPPMPNPVIDAIPTIVTFFDVPSSLVAIPTIVTGTAAIVLTFPKMRAASRADHRAPTQHKGERPRPNAALPSATWGPAPHTVNGTD